MMAQLLTEDGRLFNEVQARVLLNVGAEELNMESALGPEQVSDEASNGCCRRIQR